MKEFKGFLFYFTIMFIILVSFLFLNIHNTSEKAMNKTLTFEADDEFKNFITESRNTLNEYRMRAKTQERLECLNEFEKAVNYIDRIQNQGEKTYKELWQDFYVYILFNWDESFLSKSTSIKNKCNISNNNDAELGHERKTFNRSALLYSVILEMDITRHFSVSTIPLNIGFKKVFMNIAEPGYSTLLKSGKMDVPSQMQQLGEDYISSGLKLVGDKNEE